MKSSRSSASLYRTLLAGVIVIGTCIAAFAVTEWKAVISGSPIENALYRWMPMAAEKVFGPRPPHEAIPLLGELIQKQPSAELYSLRAMNEEAALDFAAAEADWKKRTDLGKGSAQAQLDLADFYHRRMRPADEITALNVVAGAPGSAKDRLLGITQQQSWVAFQRILRVARENALPSAVLDKTYREWIARYPDQGSVYTPYFQFLLDSGRFDDADKLVAQYRSAFPKDDIFPVKARALLGYKRGSVPQGLQVYAQNFRPLWPQELVDSYFDLLAQTGSLRKFLDQAKADFERNPDDLNADARIFYYYQHQGRSDAAQQTLAEYRHRKEQRNAKWSNDELYTLANLSEQTHSYSEAARYYYALYSNDRDGQSQERALAGLANVLLDAPEQDIRLGSGDLSMYKDIGAMDPGPGFLNGILSLILNSTSPANKYFEEEQRAIPYFHRAEAAELIRLLDTQFPKSELRAALQARLLETYSNYGESEAVIRDGKQFLNAFPDAPEREQVALLMANAYQRINRPEEEFSLYDGLLAELAKKADNVPLGEQSEGAQYAAPAEQVENSATEQAEGDEDQSANQQPSPGQSQRAFQVGNNRPQTPVAATRSPEYSRVLERYLARLVSLNQLPRALSVLRKEIDRNPDDPGLYERLAEFLGQNRLGAQQEQVYQRAIQQFQDASWYHKLARFYLREKRDSDFEKLTEQVVNIFSGTELDRYFEEEVYRQNRAPNYYLQLNRYANARFPHDLVFVRNLLGSHTYCSDGWLQVVEQHWWETEDLRNQYFGCLSRNGQLEQTLASLRQAENLKESSRDLAANDPVATRFIGEAEMWSCHFEESAGAMGALAREFPADFDIGRRAASLYRSLAAFTPADTDHAVAIEENLYQANPTDRDQLAHIGDVLADRELFARAAPFWERMTTVRPGEPEAYLDPATVYWDYYDFNDALRLLNEGRTKLGNPALYRYEEGAIYENERDYTKAVAEYVQGTLQGKDDRARNRLLELARRPKLRDAVEDATASPDSGDSPDLDALKLRVDVLDAQNRPKDIEQLLSSLAARTSSLELLEWMEQAAQQKSFIAVQEAVLEREAAITSDPVRRLELRYSLVRFYEQQKNLNAAQRSIEALYSQNPKIMGVVRSTVDFYWRNQQRQRAIDVLLKAANDSYPELRTRFEFEAARKETDAGQYQNAQKLLAELLKASPYNEEYLAAMADTYARSGDDQALKSFYLSQIDTFKKAPLSQDARNREIATLRRGIIPALTRLKDYSGGVDQYIEIINKYPDDEALVSEAALYAQKYRIDQKLIDFYANTVKQSPRDFRWPMVLARAYTQLEKFPDAIDAYAAAIRVRPDRTDLRAARAELLERLMRFDEAADEYRQLFNLNYHDTQWMEQIATIRARQGRVPETVAALEAALVTNRPEKAENYFEVARRLESWKMLPQARDFAQRGVDAAGRDLLAVAEHKAGAQLYVRIMTRLRQQEQAYQRLQQAVSDADSLASGVKVATEQAEKNGIVSVTDRQWREAALAGRRATARSGMTAAMREMGATVARYFTPEEKASFVAALESKGANASDDDLSTFYLDTAQAADAPELETRWLQRLLMSRTSMGSAMNNQRRLVDVEARRLRFDELGQILEQYALTLSIEFRHEVLLSAANAYREGGEPDKELAVLQRMEFGLSGAAEQRLFALLLDKQPEELVRIILRGTDDISDRAAQYAIEHGDEVMAEKAIAARGQALAPVWTKSYNALTGLYFDDRTPSTQLAFLSALGDANIGERVSKPVDRSQQLAGNVWFYYGSGYGAWLGYSGTGDPEQFLPAILEQSPASADGYVTTAEYYSETGNADRAIDDYRRTLELAPSRADVHDRIALLYWKQQKRAEAIAEWKTALQLLDKEVDLRSVPPQFWPILTKVLNHLGSRKLVPELHPQVDAVLRDYVRKNGTYSVTQLLRAAFEAANDPSSGTAWMLELAAVAPDPNSVLNLLARATWIQVSAKEPIYQQMIARLQDRLQNAQGLEKDYAQQELRRWQLIYVRYLIAQKRFDAAAQLLDSLPKPEMLSANELELRLRIAIARNQLDSVIEQYRSLPEHAPSPETLRSAATSIQRAGMRAPARKIFEYLFAQEIAAHNLTAANMLGLAEIRLEDGDTPGAMELLRRLTLVVGQPFENLESAATLLARTGHPTEASEFFAQLVKAKPWDVVARLQLAQEQLAAGKDASDARESALVIAKDGKSLYAERVRAAEMLSNETAPLGSGELDWLTHAATSSPETADKPFFYPARVKAAQKANPEIRIRLLRNAIEQSQDSDTARVPLFFALAAAGQDRLAVSTLQPWLNTGFLENAAQPPRSPVDAEQNNEQTEEDSQQQENAGAGLAPAPLSRVERIKIAATLAASYLKLQELSSAQRYYSLAARLETSKPAKVELTKKRNEAQAIVERIAQNELRAPTIHKELDQSHLVRPRLTAAASQNGSSKGGAL